MVVFSNRTPRPGFARMACVRGPRAVAILPEINAPAVAGGPVEVFAYRVVDLEAGVVWCRGAFGMGLVGGIGPGEVPWVEGDAGGEGG